MTTLDLTSDVVELTQAICDIPSVSGDEKALADAVQTALLQFPHLEVLRDGDAVVARTSLGRDTRVVIAGHLDTVPIKDNLPVVIDGDVMRGRGTCDMKAGVAVALHLAATLTAPRYDLTFVFYDHEEVAAKLNGLGRLVRNHPEWLAGDFAILGEPSDGTVEGGCQGTMRVKITVPGVAAHSARSWRGSNAIHSAGAVLDVLRAYVPRQPVVDGLRYHEGLNAVKIEGGIAGNVIPDLCTVYVNHRFAPDRSVADAEAHLREVFAGFEVEVVDAAPGARPGLDRAAAKEFVELVGREPQAKLGWTDVSRFATLGVPAVNFGPGDPLLAHTDGESVPIPEIRQALHVLQSWLS